MPDEIDTTWELFGKKVTELRSALSRCRSVNVNTARLKTNVKDLVQLYFRQVRPTLPPLGFSEEELGSLDTEMQELLRLSNGNNRKSYYLDRVKRVDGDRRSLETQREILLSQKATILPKKFRAPRSSTKFLKRSSRSPLQPPFIRSSLSRYRRCRSCIFPRNRKRTSRSIA